MPLADSKDDGTSIEQVGNLKLPITRKASTVNKFRIKMNEWSKEEHNPIETFTDVFLDTTDGDFSVTINGFCWMMIGNDEVITIANYIEKQIEKATS